MSGCVCVCEEGTLPRSLNIVAYVIIKLSGDKIKKLLSKTSPRKFWGVGTWAQKCKAKRQSGLNPRAKYTHTNKHCICMHTKTKVASVCARSGNAERLAKLSTHSNVEFALAALTLSATLREWVSASALWNAISAQKSLALGSWRIKVVSATMTHLVETRWPCEAFQQV